MKKNHPQKETIGPVLAVIALLACCLLFTIILAGGTLTFLGVFLKNNWLLSLGMGVIFATLVAFILRKCCIHPKKKKRR